jgi:hypothetical protein
MEHTRRCEFGFPTHSKTANEWGTRQWKLFDADIGMDSAREIREYFIPDFSRWKEHDSYQTAFQRLVSDLKAEASK